MKGIILAGGKGSRLHPLTLEIPKPLVTVRKKPILSYTLGLFAKHGIREVKVIIRPSDQKDYERWQREYAKDLPDMNIEFEHEPEPMGTLGYLYHHLQGWMGNDEIFVTNADDLKEINLAKMLAAHREKGTRATVALMQMENPDEYGAVLVEAGKITQFLEKQKGLPPGLVSAGMYIVAPSALSILGEGERPPYLMFEKDLFPQLAARQELGAFVSEGRFFDCGTFDRWEEAIKYMKEKDKDALENPL